MPSRFAFLCLGALGAAGASFAQAPPAESAPASQPQPPAARSIDQLSVSELLQLARQARQAGQLSQARQIVAVVRQRDPKSLEALDLDGELALAMRDPETARTDFQAALQIQANDFRANLGMGSIYVDRQYWRQARHYLQTAASVAPPDRAAEVLILLARALRGDGQGTDAIAAIEKAITLAPQSLEARLIHVQLLMDSSAFDKALTESETAVDLARAALRDEPDKYTAIRQLDQTYSAQHQVLYTLHQTYYAKNPDGRPSDQLLPGRERIAAQTLGRLIDLQVVQAEIQHTLAFFQLLPAAEMAVRYEPTNVQHLLRMGMLLQNTSQIRKAVLVFQRVLEIDPQNQAAQQQLQALGAPLQAEPPASQPTAAEAAAESPESQPSP